MTATVAAHPTDTATPSIAPPTARPTIAPTLPAPDFPNDAKWNRFQSQEYRVLEHASIAAADGGQYQVYLLTDSKLNSVMLNQGAVVDVQTVTGPGVCVLVFYYWDGYRFHLLTTHGETDQPIWCQILDWDHSATLPFYPFQSPDQKTRAVLKLTQQWSDINNNGAPEVAVMRSDCYNNCQAYDGVTVSFYELRPTGVVDIAAGLSGTLMPDHLLYSQQPPSFFVYAPTLYAFEERLEWTAIYSWSDSGFVDISPAHPEYYEGQIAELVSDLAKKYGGRIYPYMTSPFLTILGTYNAAKLPREEGLSAFLEVSDPRHWPQTDQVTLCWLELARAYAQMDYAQGQPFRIFAMEGAFASGNPDDLADLAKAIDPTRYDVTACP